MHMHISRITLAFQYLFGQACVRGYQVRKQYKLILWAVGILDKVVLRWRRKRIGIQSVRQEMESNEEESDDADFLNVFRKEKVNAAIEKALKRVLSMVHSTGARQQYRRLLSLCRQAKVNTLMKAKKKI